MKFIDYVEKLKLEARKQNIRIVRDEVDKPWVKTKINTFITPKCWWYRKSNM